MRTQKAFTVIELLLVVIFIVLLSIFIVNIMPRYRGGREPSNQIKCATQLNGIGKAIALYNNDYREAYPIVWGENVRPDAQFGMGLYNASGQNTYTRWVNPTFNQWDSEPTVGGCLYLLIKYEDLVPNMLICPSSEVAEEMDLQEVMDLCRSKGWPVPQKWGDLNDFRSMTNLSYSYNDPWAAPLKGDVHSDMAVMADINNAYCNETGVWNTLAGNAPVVKDDDWTGKADENRAGNSPNHAYEMQNVLFADTHVKRCETPLVGIDEDNIYTHWNVADPQNPDKRIGLWNGGHAQDPTDSYLGN
ncbi:MAG: hypothetical protein JW709_03320 [Sedimentisphaerales bacterium]|nr:hypothetical protein [Sedimentisphaerales bacterium]